MSSTAVHLLDLVGSRRRRSGCSNGGDSVAVEDGSRRVTIQSSLDLTPDLAVLRTDPDHLLLESGAKSMELGGRGMANVEAESYVRRTDVGAPCAEVLAPSVLKFSLPNRKLTWLKGEDSLQAPRDLVSARRSVTGS